MPLLTDGLRPKRWRRSRGVGSILNGAPGAGCRAGDECNPTVVDPASTVGARRDPLQCADDLVAFPADRLHHQLALHLVGEVERCAQVGAGVGDVLRATAVGGCSPTTAGSSP
jgi:hypothetical protein